MLTNLLTSRARSCSTPHLADADHGLEVAHRDGHAGGDHALAAQLGVHARDFLVVRRVELRAHVLLGVPVITKYRDIDKRTKKKRMGNGAKRETEGG
jgi:hypothetical protein